MKPNRSEPKKRNAPVWVKVCVGLHLFAITAWALPLPRPEIMQGKAEPHASDWLLYYNWRYVRQFPPVYDYLMFTGTWQYWDMFAPNPASTDFYGDAIVVYRNGSEKVWDYPRMEKLSIPLKYMNERYRKFYERVHKSPEEADSFCYLWPVYGQKVAEMMFSDIDNPPVNVKLRRNWIEIQPPGKPQWTGYRSYVFYTYEVDQKALLESKEKR